LWLISERDGTFIVVLNSISNIQGSNFSIEVSVLSTMNINIDIIVVNSSFNCSCNSSNAPSKILELNCSLTIIVDTIGNIHGSDISTEVLELSASNIDINIIVVDSAFNCSCNFSNVP